MLKRFSCLTLMLLGIGCVNDSPSTRNHPGTRSLHSVVFLNGNDTNNVDLLVRQYTDDVTLGDTLLHQFVGPGQSSDTFSVPSQVKFGYTLYWADSSSDGGPVPNTNLAVYSYSNVHVFSETDSAHYAVSMRGDVVTFTESH